jgi:hypothetical protein
MKCVCAFTFFVCPSDDLQVGTLETAEWILMKFDIGEFC